MYRGSKEQYCRIREELIRCYKTMTKRYFVVIAPKSVFLTIEQLEALEERPPICGIDIFTRVVEMPVTIERIIQAYEIGGDEFQIGFKYPKRDIKIIYETIQESIRLWIDIIINAYNYNTPSLEELRAMERVTKALFFTYKHYHRETIRKELDKMKTAKEHDITDIFMNVFKYGKDGPDDISFVSYVDVYQEAMSSRPRQSNMYLDDEVFQRTPDLTKTKLIKEATPHETKINWLS